jgi:hypothetical protein
MFYYFEVVILNATAISLEITFVFQLPARHPPATSFSGFRFPALYMISKRALARLVMHVENQTKKPAVPGTWL